MTDMIAPAGTTRAAMDRGFWAGLYVQVPRLAFFLFSLAILCQPAWADQIVWPVPPCRKADITNASPAPLPSDSSSLSELPFVVGFTPRTAALVVGIADDGQAVIRCVVLDHASSGLEGAAIVAVAGLKFARPAVPNVSIPQGRYLVRVSTLYGLSWLRPPPQQTMLPSCPNLGRSEQRSGSGAEVVERVSPAYPVAAEREGIEGSVSVGLEVYSNGDATPVCLNAGEPAGWFEAEAVRAASAWRFRTPMQAGLRFFTLTLHFRLQ